ncbi:MAG: PIN/TRAM domain-containing protein [Candidatus Nanogingivalis sp.]|mgnify:CR=1 FL=1|jgi:pilT protein domain protein
METILLFLILSIVCGLWFDLKNDKPLISKAKKQVLVDTSILIDGRFLAVARTGFINFDILIPRSVVGELQILADGGDDEKRVRARYGLDIISALQNEEKITVSILADGNSAEEGVDNRLISLAKKMNADILTADYNLNKVAKVEGIEVLNINELVQSVRADYLPGEKIMLEITQKGNEKKQGIGHLPDGTMVVVENGEGLIGTISEVEFIRSLQTAAGKMMFARLASVKVSKVEIQKSKGRAPVLKNVTGGKKSKESSKKSKNIKQNSKAKTKTQTRHRTRKTVEDSLVKLANRD